MRAWTKLGSLSVLGIAFCLSSCGAPNQTARTKEQLQGLPQSGFVPHPIWINLSTGEPVLIGGEYQSGWDGTITELLATDAYADCARNASIARDSPVGYPVGFTNGDDAYLRHLKSLATQLSCVQPLPANAPFPAEYVNQRSGEGCAVDTLTGERTTVEFKYRDENVYASYYDVLPLQWDDYATDPNVFAHVVKRGGWELEYADLNLCMAQRLRSQLNGGQSLFTNTDDHIELLSVIRERAQLATLYYSLLAKVFSSTETDGTTVGAEDYHFLILIHEWAKNWAGDEALSQIGSDFASAVRLQLDATQELAQALERSAATRPVGNFLTQDLSRAGRDWGLGQPRMQLLNLLYGGDPLGTPSGPIPPGRGQGGGTRAETTRPFVQAEMTDPRIGSLIGLARTADALYLKLEEESGEVVGFAADESAERLYREVEVHLQVQLCESETPGDPACDPDVLRSDLPGIESADQYLLWQRYRVEPKQARVFSEALAEAFSGLVSEQVDLSQTVAPGPLHLTGAHDIETISGESWAHVDSDFDVVGLVGYEIAHEFSRVPFLPASVRTDADPRYQGFVFSPVQDRINLWEELRSLGTLDALAFAREAIVMGEGAPSFATPFFQSAEAVLGEIEREVGVRTMIRRPIRWVKELACTIGEHEFQSICRSYLLDFDEQTNEPQFELFVLTDEDDPLDELVIADANPFVGAIAVDAQTVGFEGEDRADLDGLTAITPTTNSLSGGRELRVFEYDTSTSGDVQTVLLRGQDPDDPSGPLAYQTVANQVWSSSSLNLQTRATTFGGTLNALGERTMKVLKSDWSRPAYDAFGFPTDWVPPSDASLVGGTAGQPSYQYYLEAAKAAANEATAAVQTAIDGLVEQAIVGSELEAAEARAASIADLETRALCGDRESCAIPLTPYRAQLPECGPGDGNHACNILRSAVDLTLTEVDLAEEVVSSLVNRGFAAPFPPDLSGLEGSEMERILTRQWAALLILDGVVDQAYKEATNMGMRSIASQNAFAVAEAEHTAAREAYDAEVAQLDVGDAEVAALLAQLEAQKAELSTLTLNQAIADRECSPQAYEDAFDAGKSFTAVKDKNLELDTGYAEFHWEVESYKNKNRTWSPGNLYAQHSRCQGALDKVNLQLVSYQPTLDAIQATEAALLAKTTLSQQQREAIYASLVAAVARYEQAKYDVYFANSSAYVQASSVISQVQQAQVEVVDAARELRQARLRAENAIASSNLELDIAESSAAERFGLQRKYRSYDMWRARALLESARRMAVAARRGIEARFAVNLSDLEAKQAFVDSPSIWADEVYGTDLNAPSVVGLTAIPDVNAQDAVYPNKILDYVGNLERFVQGYTVSYPTSVASPDTEVITLPGPEQTQEDTLVTAEDEGLVEEQVEVLSEEALGWSFYCESAGEWLTHPGLGQFPLQDRLMHMCDGLMPTRMRIGFALDPWGRLNNSINAAPLTQRHNVRWRRVAVNLIGTGIRDCQAAVDPEACYSESFLAFQLSHAGPSWVRSHAQRWRSFNLPTASIESGKALSTEEWLDPIANSWNSPFVSNVARGEFFGRPINGSYELIVELSQDVRPERIERVQLLVETDYWVSQQ